MITTSWPRFVFCALISVALVLPGCEREAAPDNEEHAATVAQTLEPFELGSIARLHTHQGVFLASQPSPEDLEQAKKDGVVTIIDLRHPDEADSFDERQVAEDLGLAYHNPAWNGPDELTDEIFDEVRDLLNRAERPILIHCGSANRVGPMWMAYRSLDDGLDVEAAAVEARVVGMKTPAYEARAYDYIARMRTD